MISPTSDAIRDKNRTKNLTTSHLQGSTFTYSAELSMLMVPELRHKHEKEPTEINEMLQIKQPDIVESELAKVVDLYLYII